MASVSKLHQKQNVGTIGSHRGIERRRKKQHVNFDVYPCRIYMLFLNVYADCNKISSVIYHRRISKYKFS